jgi:hypothetical protein
MERRGRKVQPAKGRRRKTTRTKAGKALAARATISDLKKRLSQRTRELEEALQQQTATADVLSIIASSPGELEPVFETMLANATQICGAEFGLLYRSEGVMLPRAAAFV